jgi:hypothetical protein
LESSKVALCYMEECHTRKTSTLLKVLYSD